MIGERRFPTQYGTLQLEEGGYGRDLKGRWFARAPGESLRRPINPKMVVEHPDATITVRGVLNGGLRCFALERGVWTILDGGAK